MTLSLSTYHQYLLEIKEQLHVHHFGSKYEVVSCTLAHKIIEKHPSGQKLKPFLFKFSRLFQAPTWAYLACALGLFIYQSLDAIDGKQARRTNSSTPLGELFDHGCDSLSTGLLMFVYANTVRFYYNYIIKYFLAILTSRLITCFLNSAFHNTCHLKKKLYRKCNLQSNLQSEVTVSKQCPYGRNVQF